MFYNDLEGEVGYGLLHVRLVVSEDERRRPYQGVTLLGNRGGEGRTKEKGEGWGRKGGGGVC